MNTTKIQSLDQRRADYALQKVDSVKSDQKEYKNLSKGAPALVMSNGLMQALAFYRSRQKGYSTMLGQHVQEWLYKNNLVSNPDFETAMKDLCQCDSSRYIRATDEALEILRWIRQFADALY